MQKRMFPQLLIKAVAAISPTVILIFTLIHYFPYTGLGRIIAVPETLLINLLLILSGLLLSRKIQFKPYKILLWLLIILLTLVITVLMYPQESGPDVVDVLWDKLVGK